MKTEKDYYVDSNGNKWNKSLETKNSAIEKSKTLVNCRNCRNCSDCINCSYCSDCSDCSYCSDCINCNHCINCSYCSDCSDCSDFKTNPERIVSPKIGSRNAQTTVYWNNEKEQVVCGCFSGTIEEFKSQVILTHGNNQYAQQYLQFIEKVEQYKN